MAIPDIVRVNKSYIGRYLDKIIKAGEPSDCCCIVCPPCSGFFPTMFEVESAGWTSGECGTPCFDWNSNFVLDLNGPGLCKCAWTYAEDIKCTGLPASNTDAIFLKILTDGISGFLDVGFAHNTVIACTDGACNYHYQKWVPLPIDCTLINTTIPLTSTGCVGLPDQCYPPNSITLRAL